MKRTKDYKVILDNPWCQKGTIIRYNDRDELMDYENYPHIFSPIYKFDSGEEVANGDVVYRIRFIGDVEAVSFDSNITCGWNVFPSLDSAFDFLLDNNTVFLIIKSILNGSRICK